MKVWIHQNTSKYFKIGNQSAKSTKSTTMPSETHTKFDQISATDLSAILFKGKIILFFYWFKIIMCVDLHLLLYASIVENN